MAPRACIVCGGAFDAPPSSKKITCSRACSTIRKRDSHRGVANTWSPEARQRAAERGRTPNLEKGTPAAQQSPLAGPFETNQEAKIWWLRSLDTGEQIGPIRNLRKFCRDHPELWAPDPWRNAYAGLRIVQASLVGTRTGPTGRPVSRWKGWTLVRPAVHPDGAGHEG